ncbi:uncharacterized protein LOC111258914 isoform X1 [Varroa jacobsoni]|nr:uncharacterized protein LOC111258914 isoform X1 [Varroa jacobsoni]
MNVLPQVKNGSLKKISRMPRGPELTMLDMSVLRPSTVPNSGHLKVNKPESKARAASEALDFSKLRGKAKTTAIEHLEEVIESLPKIAEEQARALKVLQDRTAALQRILYILRDDADKLPMDALGDFGVLATNPEPFAAALEESMKSYENRSPDRKNNAIPGNLRKILKTSASLNRTTARTKASNTSTRSAKVNASTLRQNRAPSRSRIAATPLNKQSAFPAGSKKKVK